MPNQIKTPLFILMLLSMGCLSWYFFRQQPGVGLVLFESILLAVFYYLYRRQLNADSFSLYLFALTVISGISTVVVHSSLAFTVHVVLFFLSASVNSSQKSRNLFYQCIQSLGKFSDWLMFSGEYPVQSAQKNLMGVVRRILKLSIIPALIATVFFIFYWVSVPDFGENIRIAFSWFPEIDLQFVLLFALGLALALYYWSRTRNVLSRSMESMPDLLMRTRRNPGHFKLLSLKNELRSHQVLLVTLNVLILYANVLDVRHIWMGSKVMTYDEMQLFVRMGTFTLIVALFLSIFISAYIFRGNLNFLAGNRTLKILVYSWIAQNAFMAFSILVRNITYIELYNLAHKRLAVFVFLVAALVGLLLLAYKIYMRRTTFYLIRTNTNFIAGLLVFCSFFNWDLLIARHNVSHPQAFLDKDYLVTLDYSTIPVLLQHRELFTEKVKGGKNFEYLNKRYPGYTYEQVLMERKDLFTWHWKQMSWQAWNWRDGRTFGLLEQDAATMLGNK